MKSTAIIRAQVQVLQLSVFGAVAQMVERALSMREAVGSMPTCSNFIFIFIVRNKDNTFLHLWIIYTFSQLKPPINN